MKSKRESNARFRLVLTLSLAVVLPALTLIVVNFQHVKSIQRDKKVEALIHRDFQYLLSISAKKMAGKAYALTEQVRNGFPVDADSDDEKRRKLDLVISQNPWFTHVFLFDAKKGIILQPHRDRMNDKEAADSAKMYSGWFGLEVPYLCEQLRKKSKPIMWYGGEADRPSGSTYVTTAIFSFPELGRDRTVLGGVSFDPNYLKTKFFPEVLEEVTSPQFTSDPEQLYGQGFYEFMPNQVSEHPDQRLAMMVYPADALKAEPDRPLAASAGWSGGKPDVSYKLDDPFRGLALGIKFQGTTAEAISRRWVWQSFLILGVLSVLMIGGLVLTYRSVNKQVALARLKSDFVSNVSHELRTPLALIRLYAETLELGRTTTQEKKHEYYSIIRKESERLSSLINNILDFSRIEAGAKEY